MQNAAPSMSALGQKQTYAVQNAMSALPPIATAEASLTPHACPAEQGEDHMMEFPQNLRRTIASIQPSGFWPRGLASTRINRKRDARMSQTLTQQRNVVSRIIID